MQFKHIFPAVLAVAAVQAQNNTMNLTSLIAGNTDLSGLSQLLQQYPNVATSLASASNVTLFAPSNQALQAVSAVLASAGGNTSNLVQALLDYHTVKGVYLASNITAQPAFPRTMLNMTAYSNVTGGQVVECRLVNNTTVEVISGLKTVANVTQANLNFTGGVVHVINSVLQIPGNFSSVAVSANLTALVGATEATNLTSSIDSLQDVTIFAPSNSAFQAIGSAASNLSASMATQILEYHVINGTIAYSSSLGNTTIPTLGGKNVTITVANSTIFVNGARVINPDILISGGVMHVIDSVLNPNNTQARGNSSETSATAQFSGASSATAVPFTSGVATPTTTIGALITTASQVASGYSSVAPAGGSKSAVASGAGASSSSKAGAAAMQTGAVGAAALFGGAALLANF
ncbi:hypothetical protein LTR62_000128 [Meristemomyces frigidus]|uniref:FAS1 domain-containing protein n=1 Tax=Meristemomyces frigidus TaxID=1508187 RepID=A0AAN7YNP3_9PEZI|nr:hypothetical protein LTR62_000128 [Meristemomyces frigidus]